MVINALKEFFRFEGSGGILLLLAAVLAMLIENSSFDIYYKALLDIPVEIRFGEFEIAKPLLLWINDGLMALFFFLIGLEIKREVLAGELSEPARIILPAIAAVGGMAIPAAIYAYINWDNPIGINGWAIPSATDIAFALGVLALLGSRVPHTLKLFLMTLAIVDDLGAIIIIAIFYTVDLSITSLIVAAAAIAVLFIMNRRGVVDIAPYLLVGMVLWASVLKSGVHATLAGVITALFIPFVKKPNEPKTQLELLEHDLQPLVAFGILPLFAFANTGLSFEGLTMQSLTHSVPLGIAAGLFFGNQLGVFAFTWLTIKFGLSKMPQGASWLQIYGISLLCGIGFTMSLFISSLAFEQGSHAMAVDDRLGILLGSLASGILGYLVLRFAANKNQPAVQG